ncbi:hypothetical protein ILUMI_21349 [Ignelater luminosus]|uniref:Metalloendopeptidase n=1 Tax=Ignelater luminosus TaxID=2038154 RepID=A0A8K0CGK8_IGNLU|nr:hypothetical protein ILUMI_21349 [Ignelater luminosus]
MYGIIIFIITTGTLQLVVSNSAPYYRPLSPEQAAKLSEWNTSSLQQMWELSGQYEGDMVLQPNQLNGVINTRFRWPNREIPYEISSDFTPQEKQFIAQAIQIEYGRTCLNIRPRQASDVDFVYITGDDIGCWSNIGRVGGPQILNLQRSEGCIWKGTIAHEFLHAAGFVHQHSATERDDYLEILWNNIIEDQKYNFVKYGYSDITSFGETYDYDSVMHYGRYAFSANERPTILPKDPTANIGQNNALSRKDIIKLHKMYNCTV